MTKGLLRKLCRAFYLQDSLPDTVTIPATGEGQQAIEKPIEEATLDDIAFAAQALDKETDVLYSRLSVLRRLYRSQSQRRLRQRQHLGRSLEKGRTS